MRNLLIGNRSNIYAFQCGPILFEATRNCTNNRDWEMPPQKVCPGDDDVRLFFHDLVDLLVVIWFCWKRFIFHTRNKVRRVKSDNNTLEKARFAAVYRNMYLTCVKIYFLSSEMEEWLRVLKNCKLALVSDLMK